MVAAKISFYAEICPGTSKEWINTFDVFQFTLVMHKIASSVVRKRSFRKDNPVRQIRLESMARLSSARKRWQAADLRRRFDEQ
jgi:hypothetical protein